MTTRDDTRRQSDVRAEPGRATSTGSLYTSLSERLLEARERKGVDLYRAERDTKIRARYLGALERGDYRELPGSVYTKGFLRNYAIYLGLDPDEILLQWRRERGEDKARPEPVIVPHRALTAPRSGFTFSPAVLVAALMTVVLIAFFGYLAVQLLRFNKPPTVSVSDPSSAMTDVADGTTSYVIRGTTIARGTVTVNDAASHSLQTTAASDGTWNQEVELRRGRNDFSISATDPDTGKVSDQTVSLIINVPISAVLAPTLSVDSPADGASFQNGAIPVSGTAANATQVTVSAAYVGPAPGAKGPTPSASPKAPAPVSVAPDADGTFSTPFVLTTGRWQVTIAASSAEGKATTIVRTVTVAYKGVNVTVTLKGRAWLKVWVDGQLDPSTGAAGRVYPAGKVLTYSGDKSVEVRTGSSGQTLFTVNGTNLGHLGASGSPETWLFTSTAPPKQTNDQ
jgi:cytoskeletal protein RodZ